MSCKLTLNNSFKSNCDPIQWTKSPSMDGNVKLAGEEAKDRLYEPKHEKKLFRVMTVIAYIFFVSLAAIMLSLYYVFIWNGHLKENAEVKTVVIPYRAGCDDVNLDVVKVIKFQRLIRNYRQDERIKCSTMSEAKHARIVSQVDPPQTSVEQETTIDFEESTAFTTQVNFTQQPEEVEDFNEFNTELEDFQKSVFIKKLIRHHNMMPK